MIRSEVAKGGYSSDSDVVREALRLWQDRRQERDHRLDVIRAKIQAAIDDPVRVTDDELNSHFDNRQVEAQKLRK